MAAFAAMTGKTACSVAYTNGHKNKTARQTRPVEAKRPTGRMYTALYVCQHAHMGFHAAAQGAQVVAAFEHADDAAFAVALR